MMDSMFIFRFVLGLAIGSFLNVVASRYDPEKNLFNLKNLGGRSHCPACKAQLRWWELVPLLSFALQRGRCRSCRGRISFQYPIVELASGVVLAFLPLAVFSAFNIRFLTLTGSSFFAYYLLASLFVLAGLALVLIAAIDLRRSLIPDELNIVVGALGILIVAAKAYFNFFEGLGGGSFLGHYALIAGFRSNVFVNHGAAAAIGFLLFLSIVLLSRGRGMGMGDVKLAGALGLLLGWPDAMLALIISFIIGAIVSVVFLIVRAKTMKSMIPFGPFMSAAAFVVIFFGRTIVDFYFTLFPL
jgi:leader peptidase (prepilin peptidase)/N-methyltransferase